MLKQRKRNNSTGTDKTLTKKPKIEDGKEVVKSENVSKKVKLENKKKSRENLSNPPTAKTLKNKGNKKAGKPGTTKETANEKTDWRKFKVDKKELKVKRKQTKDIYEISIESKKLYEQLKCHRTQNKAELVEKLFKLFSKDDTLRKMTLAHDTARIVQCMLKCATPELHNKIAELLLPHIVEMSMSKYAHFCVLRMLKNGSNSIKSRLADSLMGSIVKMSLHSLASKILDNIYLNLANPKQQVFMRQEFYGEMYRRHKDETVKQLSDAYSTATNMKPSILSTVKSHLDRLANKKLIDNSLVHAVMLEYVNACDDEKMEETITAFAPLMPHMLTTKEGVQAAMICFFKSVSKHRRAIIKAIKEHLTKICTHEQGHVFIVALVNALDDTKATKKAIYEHIHTDIEILMSNNWGRRVIEWFVSPGDTNCFHPNFIAAMDEGLKYSKKDKDIRRKEVFESVQEPIATAIAEKPEFWLSDRHIALVTANILKKLEAEHYAKVAKALAIVVANPDWTVVEDIIPAGSNKKQDVEQIISAATKLKRQKKKAIEATEDGEDQEQDDEEIEQKKTPGIEDAGLHIVLKKIIKSDKERLSQQADIETFGALLVRELSAETLKYWLTVNRACFVLLNMLENNNETTIKTLQQLLKSHKQLLEAQPTSGARLLLKKLN